MSKVNVFQYAANCEANFERNLSEVGNYERKTTFYSDLSIAEWHSAKSIIDTYRIIVKEWLSNVEYFTEFILCLNYKSWEWHAREDRAMTQLYVELYEKSVDEFFDRYKNDRKALDYYYRVTD